MDISEILTSLSNEDIEELQKTAEKIFGNESIETERKSDKTIVPQIDTKSLNTFSAIAGIMQKMNEKSDQRCALIGSLKPMLSPERQEKAEKAVKILKLLEIIPLLKEKGLLNGVI